MKKLLQMFFLIFLTSCLGGKTDSQIREESKFNTKSWMQKMNVEGTALCNHRNPFICEVHPKYQWPPVVLYCHDSMCELLE